jgi:hypothetical protein
LSGYAHKLYEKYQNLIRWNFNTFDVASCAGKGRRTEMIWRNY